MRQIQIGTVVDSFSVIDFDGSKKSGETEFLTTSWLNGEVVSNVVTITEISDGEYSISFNASTIGFLKIQIEIDYNGDIVEFEYNVGNGSFESIYDLILRIAGLGHENIFIDNTTYDGDGQLIGSRVRIFDTKEHCDIATSGGDETTGLLGTYTQGTVWEGINQFNYYKQVKD